jgi:phosphoglycolate phosphatase
MSHGSATLISKSFQIDPQHDDLQLLRQQFLQHYAQGLLQKSYVFHPFRELLQRFQQHAIPWGIVTNKPSQFALPLVKGLRLPLQPQHIICGDSTPHLKPHPAPVLLLCQRLGVSPENCLFVGDNQVDMHAGSDAGVHTALALWGYHHAHESLGWHADIRCKSPLDCANVLQRLLL